VSEQKYHPLVFVAFWLAVFLLIFPCQVDCVQSALLKGRLIEAIVVVLATVAEVAAPLVYAQWRTRLVDRSRSQAVVECDSTLQRPKAQRRR
jgi:hypothetical protein